MFPGATNKCELQPRRKICRRDLFVGFAPKGVERNRQLAHLTKTVSLAQFEISPQTRQDKIHQLSIIKQFLRRSLKPRQFFQQVRIIHQMQRRFAGRHMRGTCSRHEENGWQPCPQTGQFAYQLERKQRAHAVAKECIAAVRSCQQTRQEAGDSRFHAQQRLLIIGCASAGQFRCHNIRKALQAVRDPGEHGTGCAGRVQTDKVRRCR